MPARVRFLLTFIALLAIFEIPLLLEPVDREVVRPFTAGIAAVSGAVLNVFGAGVTVAGTMLVSSCFTVNINNGCNGLEATFFLLAAILAFPAPARSRVIAAVAGAALIQGVNLIRVLSLYLIGCHRREWFETFHLAVWQTIIFAIAILFFVSWTGRKPAVDPQHV